MLVNSLPKSGLIVPAIVSGHDFTTAAKLYSDAIEKNPNESTLWCNRAYARMKLEEFGYALNDASAVNRLRLPS